MVALVTASDLKGAARFRELSDVYVLDVGAIHAEWDCVLRLAGRAAGGAADAASLIDDLPPLHRFGHGGKVSRAQQTSVCKKIAPGSLVPRSLSRRVDIHKGAFAPNLPQQLIALLSTDLSTLTSAIARSCQNRLPRLTYRVPRGH